MNARMMSLAVLMAIPLMHAAASSAEAYYSAELGRFLGRDSLEYVDGHNQFAGHFVPRGTDPSGQECSVREDFPETIQPEEDPYRPVNNWIGIATTYNIFHGTYATKSCGDCTMDIEIDVRAQRYYRNDPIRNGENRPIAYDGRPIGDQNDPRNFASLVLAKVCLTNVECDCVTQDDDDLVYRHIFYRGGLGTYIQWNDPPGLRRAIEDFAPQDACDIGDEVMSILMANSRPGDGNIPSQSP